MPGGLHPPLEVIASWPAPDHEHPERQGPQLTILVIVFSVLGIAAVGARVYSRIAITKAPGLDDALAVMSLVFALALSVLVIFAYERLGTGTRIWDMTIENAAPNRVVTWVSEWLYVLASSCIKISVLLFYKRLSAPFTKTFLLATWIGIIYNIVYTVAFCLVLALICRPIDSYWNQFNPTWLGEGHKFTCGDESTSLPISGAFSVLGDFYTTLLPLMLVYYLSLPPRQKKALYALFGVGFLVVAAGIVRTYYLDFLINRTYDVLWYLYVMWIWTMFELYFAIIAASAPALKPFFRRYLVEPITTRYGYSKSDSEAGTRNTRGPITNPLGFKKGLGSINESAITVTTHSDIENPKSNYELTTRNIPTPVPENTIASEIMIHEQPNHRQSFQSQSGLPQVLMDPCQSFLTNYSRITTNWNRQTSPPSTRNIQRGSFNTATSTASSSPTSGVQGSLKTFIPSGHHPRCQHAHQSSENKDNSRYSSHYRKVMNNIDFSTSPAGSVKSLDVERQQEPRDFIHDGTGARTRSRAGPGNANFTPTGVGARDPDRR